MASSMPILPSRFTSKPVVKPGTVGARMEVANFELGLRPLPRNYLKSINSFLQPNLAISVNVLN